MTQKVGLILALLIIGVGGAASWYFASYPPTPPVPLKPGLTWQSAEVAKGAFLEAFFCPTPVGVNCANDEEERITLPPEGVRVYTAEIRHTPPLPPTDMPAWQRTQDFHTYYAEQLAALGFVHDDLSVDGGHFMHFTGEKDSIVTDYYGRVVGHKYQQVVVQTYTEDSSDCPQSQKNIFDGCNVLVAEHFSLTLSEAVPVSDILALPRRDRNDPGR